MLWNTIFIFSNVRPWRHPPGFEEDIPKMYARISRVLTAIREPAIRPFFFISFCYFLWLYKADLAINWLRAIPSSLRPALSLTKLGCLSSRDKRPTSIPFFSSFFFNVKAGECNNYCLLVKDVVATSCSLNWISPLATPSSTMSFFFLLEGRVGVCIRCCEHL